MVGIAVAEADADAEAEAEAEALLGTAASAPSRISTWPAATVELAVAVTLNSDAIRLALADVPAPYSTSVVLSGLVFAIVPAR